MQLYTNNSYLFMEKSVDQNDTAWGSFPRVFKKHLEKLCESRKILVKRIKIVHCNHNNKPAWAQNDAMMDAYLEGMDYGYRINDDTKLETSDWTNYFIQILESLDPPNIGVVGPNHSGGNTDILTYDFTSSLHIDIFGFHYPRLFVDWYAGKAF